MSDKEINDLIKKCFAFVKSNLDEFNEATGEAFAEEDINNCAKKCGAEND